MRWVCLFKLLPFPCLCRTFVLGLGKTIQVISFFASLKERGNKGPHLVVVPYVCHPILLSSVAQDQCRSSTLENWCREFARFAPTISVQTYYAGKEERPLLRQTLLDTQRSTSKTGEGWEVLITTYNLAQGDDRDRKFFRRVEWDVSPLLRYLKFANVQSHSHRHASLTKDMSLKTSNPNDTRRC